MSYGASVHSVYELSGFCIFTSNTLTNELPARYFDRTSQSYKSLPTETWASYTNWSTFTSWAGTPSDSVSFTTAIFDAGKIDWHNTLVDIQATLPADVTIYAGETLDSTAQIDIATTTTVCNHMC